MLLCTDTHPIIFNTEAWWQAKDISVLNHYQPSVPSHSLQVQCFISRDHSIHPHFTRVREHPRGSKALWRWPRFAYHTRSSYLFLFSDRRTEQVLKPLVRAGVGSREGWLLFPSMCLLLRGAESWPHCTPSQASSPFFLASGVPFGALEQCIT